MSTCDTLRPTPLFSIVDGEGTEWFFDSWLSDDTARFISREGETWHLRAEDLADQFDTQENVDPDLTVPTGL
jgi:hypothetical protein